MSARPHVPSLTPATLPCFYLPLSYPYSHQPSLSTSHPSFHASPQQPAHSSSPSSQPPSLNLLPHHLPFHSRPPSTTSSTPPVLLLPSLLPHLILLLPDIPPQPPNKPSPPPPSLRLSTCSLSRICHPNEIVWRSSSHARYSTTPTYRYGWRVKPRNSPTSRGRRTSWGEG